MTTRPKSYPGRCILIDIRRTVRTHWSAIGVPQGHIVRQLMLAARRPELYEIYDQYAYFEERRIILQEWAKRLKNIVEPESPALFRHYIPFP